MENQDKSWSMVVMAECPDSVFNGKPGAEKSAGHFLGIQEGSVLIMEKDKGPDGEGTTVWFSCAGCSHRFAVMDLNSADIIKPLMDKGWVFTATSLTTVVEFGGLIINHPARVRVQRIPGVSLYAEKKAMA